MKAPIMFSPILKRRVWGGGRLASKAPGDDSGGAVGESWEVSDLASDVSVAVAGSEKGRTLHELFSRDMAGLCGTKAAARAPDRFPLLLKILDAAENLSVQVHPGDIQAAAGASAGKHEAWCVLAAEPGARIFLGLSEAADRNRLERAIADGTMPGLLREVPVSPGDVFDIPPGTIHAAGRGVLMAEIQQTSDVTYRLFDWNRAGRGGEKRELHVADGLAVADFGAGGPFLPAPPAVVPNPGCLRERLLENGKFTMERVSRFRGSGGGPGEAELSTGGLSFHIVLATRGEFAVSAGGEELRMRELESALVPAAAGTYLLRSGNRDCEALLFSA